MASTAFKDWSRAEGLDLHAGLDQLKGHTVAVDADDYLNTLLTSSPTREPLLPAHAGLPFALQKHVDNDLQHFHEFGIKPIFVFNGLDVAAKDRSTVSKESKKAGKTLDDAWSTYDAGHGDSAVVAFGKTCGYKTYHVLRWLHAHLVKEDVKVQTAIFTAAPQMEYLVTNGFAHAVVGSASSLLFGSEKVIIQLDWEAEKFYWVDAKTCLAKLLLKQDQFADLMLLSGCGFIPPHPEIENDPLSRISATRSLLNSTNHDGHVVAVRAKDESYLNAFQKARFVLRHPIIIHADGKIEVKDSKRAPSDVHFFNGQRLPDELYMYLSCGIIGSRVLNWRTRNEIFETQPLDGGISQTYRDLVSSKLIPLRAQSMALLTRLLHRYFQKTDVSLACWFKDDDKHDLAIPDLWEESSTNADSWHLRETALPRAITADLTASPLLFAIEGLSDEAAAKKTLTPRPEGKSGFLTQHRELLGNVVFRFLHDRGYINPDHTLSAWGKAFKVALDRAKTDGYLATGTAEAEEAIFMAFELLRLDSLNAKHLFPTPPYSGAPLRGTDSDRMHTLLVSRLACLGTFRHETIGYTGPLSRHLLAYQQMTTAVRGSLRDLVEVHACNLFMSGVANRGLKQKQYKELGASLPFMREPDLGLALVVKSYLDELSNDATKRADIARWFNHAQDIEGDLQKAWKMWAAVNAGVQAADSSIINNEARKLFRTTDEWLQQKLQNAPKATPNGTS